MSSPPGQDQRAVFALLQDPATHGRADPVTRIDTHGAAVFLAGPDVYKVKRAVRYPYMDFSTLEKRRAACEAEIAVNRTNAPGIYLGVVPIAREGGALRLGGKGEIVEWAVHMRRFDETATLDRLAEKAPLGAALIDKLATAIAAAHRWAPWRDGAAATEAFGRLLRQTVDELAAADDLFPPPEVAALGAALTAAFDRVVALLRRRGEAGRVRLCPGDLRLGHLLLIAGEPVLFDAIEFDEAIATSDILYDLAFVLMDLCQRGLAAEANRLLNRYLGACDDPPLEIAGIAALPLFLALRAAIRAKVIAAEIRLDPAKIHRRAAAQAYFAAAARFLAPAPALLVAIGGLSGTGKSTLTGALAPALGRAPGALHFRSDAERKRIFAVPETARLPEAAYRPEVSAKVYGRLYELAAAGLGAGQAVIVDATHQRPEDRAAIAEVAARAGVPFAGIWLEAPIAVLMHRVGARRNDASDATAAIVAAQARAGTGAIAWPRLNTEQGPDALKAAALELVRACRDAAAD